MRPPQLLKQDTRIRLTRPAHKAGALPWGVTPNADFVPMRTGGASRGARQSTSSRATAGLRGPYGADRRRDRETNVGRGALPTRTALEVAPTSQAGIVHSGPGDLQQTKRPPLEPGSGAEGPHEKPQGLPQKRSPPAPNLASTDPNAR